MIMKIQTRVEKMDVTLESVNQWCGMNLIKKNHLIDIIVKYFSKSKYLEYEENLESTIFIDNNEVGRSYFEIYKIDGRNDLISNFKIGKNTLMSKYFFSQMNEFEVAKELECIDDILVVLYKIINDKLFMEFSNIMIDYEVNDLMEIIQKSNSYNKAGKDIHFLSNYELIENYIKLVEKVSTDNGKQCIIIINNIDHLLTLDEYSDIYDKMENTSFNTGIRFIVGCSLPNFSVINKQNVQNITIINDDVLALPEYEKIKEFAINNYPIDKDIDDEFLIYMLKGCINNICDMNHSLDISSKVLETMINKHLNSIKGVKYKLSKIELDYINM